MEDASSTSENVTDRQSVESVEVVSAKAVGDQCIDELVHRVQAEGLQLTGESGLLQQLTKRLLEFALEGEITDHLGYDKQDAAGKNGGNSPNGERSRTVLTDMGPVEIAVPRDRGGSFEPKIAKKRLTGVDEMAFVLLLYRHDLQQRFLRRAVQRFPWNPAQDVVDWWVPHGFDAEAFRLPCDVRCSWVRRN